MASRHLRKGNFNQTRASSGKRMEPRFDESALVMNSSFESQQIMEGYFTLVETVHNKTRMYNGLLSDFQNLIEVHSKTLKLLKSEENKRLDAESQLNNGDERVRRLQQENDEKERSMRILNAQLKDARGQVANQLGKINTLQADLDERDNRMEIIKKNLKGQIESLSTEQRHEISFIFQSTAALPRIESETEDSISYDETSREESRIDEEKDDATPRKAVAIRNTPSSRRRQEIGSRLPPRMGRTSIGRIASRRNSLVRSPPKLIGNATKTITTTVKFDETKQQLKTTVSIKRTSCTPRGKNWTGGQPIDQRQHRFEKYTGMTKKCVICSVGFFIRAKPALRCTDCNQHVHDKCRHKLHGTCVPQTLTPRARMAKSSRLPIASGRDGKNEMKPPLHEFCLTTAPMIPVPVVRCVIALEQKGLQTEGIYRIPGNRAKITKVLEELCEMKEVPRLLHCQDSEVLTGCIKTFLSSLRDPLIPKTSREEFVRAASNEKYSKADREEEMKKSISDLPQPNRDTLAYLCVHWHKVIAMSTLNKMTLDNVARCLAPTVVGLHNIATLRSAGSDTTEAIKVLEALLLMDTAYWEQYISFNDLDKSITTLPSSARRSNMNTSKPLWR